MDFGSFVDPFTNYLSYMILFWSGDTAIILESSSSDHISSDAFLLALVGIFCYLIIRYAKLNIVPPDPDPLSGPGPTADNTSVLLIAIQSLATPILLELSFYLLNVREKYDISSFYATFNAGFLSIAAYYPINGILTRIGAFSTAFSKVGGRPALAAAIVSNLISVLSLGMIIWACRPFLVVHSLGVSEAWPSIAVAFVVFLVPASVFVYFLYHWNAYVLGKR